jgi:hypothetical protein
VRRCAHLCVVCIIHPASECYQVVDDELRQIRPGVVAVSLLLGCIDLQVVILAGQALVVSAHEQRILLRVALLA